MTRFAFEHAFKSPRALVWRAISDTNRFNEAAGLPPVSYRDEPQPDGTTRRFGTTSRFGIELEYEELPFRWVHEQSFSVERIYSKGPVKRLEQISSIRETEDVSDGTGCVVETVWTWEPRGAIDKLVAQASIKQMALKPFRRVYAEIDERLRSEDLRATSLENVGGAVFRGHERATDEERSRIDAALPRVREVYDSPLIALLREALVSREDHELRRMKPIAFAREWRADRTETLNTFLAATRAGLLRMRWDVICPHCRGDKDNFMALHDVRERAFCESCNVDFDVDMNRGLEAVFMPHPRAREVDDLKYCLGGPGLTPHVVYHSFLRPGAEDSFSIRLPRGRYRARFTGEKTYRWLTLEREGEGQGGGGRQARDASHATRDAARSTEDTVAALEIGSSGSEAAFVVLDAHVEGADRHLFDAHPVLLSFRNGSRRNVVVSLERIEWAKDSLSAAELVADQRFRDLFGEEVLAPGVKLAVERATILFTDLVGSTAMYQALGDAPAFSLVWTHFDFIRETVDRHRGAIVKSIGDAIMAVFMDPENALSASDELHRSTAAYCRERGHSYPVRLKIGLHDGPCIAVTLNRRLDYFGSAVNLAARIEGKCEGGEILLSRSLAEQTNDAAVLRKNGWISEAISASAKGFSESIPMLRFRRERSV